MSRKTDPLKLHGIDEDDYSDEDSKSTLDEEYFKNCPPVQKIYSVDIVEIRSKDDCSLSIDSPKSISQNRVISVETTETTERSESKEFATPKVSTPKVNKPHTIVSRNSVPQQKNSHTIPIYNIQTMSNISTRTAGSSIYSEILPVYSQTSSPNVPNPNQRLLNDSDDNENVSWCSCC